jgi:hypothetical protein
MTIGGITSGSSVTNSSTGPPGRQLQPHPVGGGHDEQDADDDGGERHHHRIAESGLEARVEDHRLVGVEAVDPRRIFSENSKVPISGSRK